MSSKKNSHKFIVGANQVKPAFLQLRGKAFQELSFKIKNKFILVSVFIFRHLSVCFRVEFCLVFQLD